MATNNKDGAISQDEIDDLLNGTSSSGLSEEQKTKNENKQKAKQKAKENIQKRINENKESKSNSEKKNSRNSKSNSPSLSTREKAQFTTRTNEILSQDEIDQLLNAISSDGNNGDDEETTPSNYSSRRIKIYDFKRPDRFSKEQLRFVSNTLETLARNMTTQLSSDLQTMVHIHIASVDQLTYEEFIRSIPVPSTQCIANWDIKDFEGLPETNYFTTIEIDPVLSAYMLHGRLIDEVNSQLYENDIKEDTVSFAPYYHYTLSRFEEETLKNQIFTAFYKELADCFNDAASNAKVFTGFRATKDKPCYTLKAPTVDNLTIEQNPQFVQIVTPSEMVILVTIEMSILDESGMINICLPYPFVRDILIKGNILMTPSTLKNQNFGLQVIPGNAFTSLGDFNIPEGAKLAEGMIIELPKLAGEPVDLIDKKTGNIFAKAEVVVIEENFGIRIVDVLDESLKEPEDESDDSKK